jgi:hypothetical protein
MQKLLTYSRFQTPGDAEYLIGLLKQNDIPYILTHEVNQIDNIYIGESLDPMFELKIDQSDFHKVSELLAKEAINDYKTGSPDHYFNLLDAEELREIIQNPNGWNAYDIQTARLLLSDRSDMLFDQKGNVELTAAHKPEMISQSWILMGYLLSVLTIVGIFIGLSITQAKKTLSNGQTVYIYDNATIAHGRNMVLLGTITTCIYLFLKLSVITSFQ